MIDKRTASDRVHCLTGKAAAVETLPLWALLSMSAELRRHLDQSYLYLSPDIPQTLPPNNLPPTRPFLSVYRPTDSTLAHEHTLDQLTTNHGPPQHPPRWPHAARRRRRVGGRGPGAGQLRRRGTQVGQAGAGRVLRAVVRPLQEPGARLRGAGGLVRPRGREADHRQGRRRRQPLAGPALRRPGLPDAEVVRRQERDARGLQGRQGPREPAELRQGEDGRQGQDQGEGAERGGYVG